MKRVWFLLIALVLLAASVPVSAQDGGVDQPIDGCTAEEIAFVADILPSTLEEYGIIMAAWEQVSDRDQLADVIDAAEGLQRAWWAAFAQLVPDCSLGIRTTTVVGRVLDETLITLLLMEHGTDFLKSHTDRLSEAVGELSDLVDLVDGLSGE